MRRFIEFWVDSQKTFQAAVPGLMTKEIDLWNKVNIMLAADLNDFLYIVFGQGIVIPELRVAFVLVIVIDAEDQCINLKCS